MFQLIYVSSARGLLSKEELLEILSKSRKNNEQLAVTGLLLYRDGNILQLLEGEKEAVERLFTRISDDPRHTGVIVLFRGEVPRREFPDWSMGFRDLMSEEVRNTPGFNEFMNTPLDDLELSNLTRTQKLMRIFKS